MFILKKGHQPGVYVPLRALFLVLSGKEDMHESLNEFEFRKICHRVTALD